MNGNMKERMLAYSKKKLITQIIIAGILCVIGVAISGKTLFNLSTGPVDLDTLREGVPDDEFVPMEKYDELEGEYVSMEVEFIFGEYCRETSKNTSTGHTTTTSIGYFAYDDQTGYCIGIYSSNGKSGEYDRLMDDTYEWFADETAPDPEPLTVTGTLRKMEGKELKYFTEVAEESEIIFANDEWGYYPTYDEYTVMYTIDTKEVGGSSPALLALSAMILIPCSIWLTIVIINLATGSSYKKVKKFIAKNGLNEEEVSNDFASASRIDNVYVGTKYTYFVTGTKWELCKNEDLVWAYYYRRTGKYAVSRINAYHYDKKVTYINCSQGTAESVLRCYDSIFPKVIVGYSDDLEREFRKDYNMFLSHKYNVKTGDILQGFNPQTAAANATAAAPQASQPAGDNIPSYGSPDNMDEVKSVCSQPGNYDVKLVATDSSRLKETEELLVEVLGIEPAKAHDMVFFYPSTIASGVSEHAALEIGYQLSTVGADTEMVEK